MNVVIGNVQHPEFGVLTIPFPIPKQEYGRCMEMLGEIEIGSATEQDCKVLEINSAYETLRRLEKSLVNVDELDTLAKLLDNFCDGEDDKFEAMGYLLDLHDIKDFINLALCCNQTTVITDFKDLESVGKDHFLTLHSGTASMQEYEKLDGAKLIKDLIAGGKGKLTPYGVVFDNDMKLEQVYCGTVFPSCLYGHKLLDIVISPPSGEPGASFLQLPMPEEQLNRLLERGGFGENDEFPISFGPEMPPKEVAAILNSPVFQNATLYMVHDLNRMSAAIEGLSETDHAKLNAVVRFAVPKYPFQIQHLAEHLEDFEFVPGVKTNEEYGKYMIQESGQFNFDPDLEQWYDYRKYGDDHTAWREGRFTEHGYVAYYGELSLDELMMESSQEEKREQCPQVGGMV